MPNEKFKVKAKIQRFKQNKLRNKIRKMEANFFYVNGLSYSLVANDKSK